MPILAKLQERKLPGETDKLAVYVGDDGNAPPDRERE